MSALRFVTTSYVLRYRKKKLEAFKKYTTKRRVNEPVAFSCLEYLIATTKQILALAMGKRCGLDSDLSNLRIRIRAVFPLHICSCLNKLQSTHVENKYFKLSFSSMYGD